MPTIPAVSNAGSNVSAPSQNEGADSSSGAQGEFSSFVQASGQSDAQNQGSSKAQDSANAAADTTDQTQTSGSQSASSTAAGSAGQGGTPAQRLTAQIQELLQSGASITTIAQAIAKVLAQYAAAQGTQTGDSSSTLSQLVAALQGNSGKGSSSASAGTSTTDQAISDIVRQLTAKSGAQAPDAATLANRILQLAGLINGIVAQNSVAPVSGSDDSNSKDSKKNAAASATANSAIDPSTLTAMLASGAAQTSAAQTPAAPADTPAKNTSAQATAATTTPQYAAASALGLETSNSNANTGGGSQKSSSPTVRSLAPVASAPADNNPLMRILERATNAQIARTGQTPDGGDDLVAKITQTLAALDRGNGNTDQAGAAGAANSGGTGASFAGALAATANSSSGSSDAVAATGSAAKTASLSTDDTHGVMSQIISSISIRDSAGSQVVRLTLTPPHLGDITVNVTINPDRTVNATVLTNSADVRATVLANSQELTRTFNEAGLKLGHLGVDLSGQGSAGDQQNRDQAEKDQSRRPQFTVNTTNDTSDESAKPGPSLLNSVNLQLLNQLV